MNKLFLAIYGVVVQVVNLLFFVNFWRPRPERITVGQVLLAGVMPRLIC